MSSRSSAAPASTIYVCQSDPDAWSPKPKRLPGNPCPAGGANYKIGRAQTEVRGTVGAGVGDISRSLQTDSLLMDWPAKLNKMDEVWVPTQYVPGVRRVLVVDGSDLLTHLAQASSGLVREEGCGSHEASHCATACGPRSLQPCCCDPALSIAGYGARPVLHRKVCLTRLSVAGNYPDSIFRFLSILNWERRKGWDLLLRAYLSAFTRSDNVGVPRLSIVAYAHGCWACPTGCAVLAHSGVQVV